MLAVLNPQQIEGPFSALVKHGALRTRARASGLVTAAEAVGEFPADAVVTGVTKGGFSMLDLIEHLLTLTGPADVAVSTWTMGVYDADLLWRFANVGAITSIRFVLDPSIFKVDGQRSRHSAAFLGAFGGEAIRAVSNHAKFTVLDGVDRHITICSSMNLNRNKRLENFVIFDGTEIAAFYRGIVDQVFRQVRPIADAAKVSQAGFAALYLGDELDRSAGVDRDDGAHPRRHRGASREAVEVW